MIGHPTVVAVAGAIAVAVLAINPAPSTSRAPIECARFEASGRIIDVGPEGGAFDFAPAHRVVFPAGAVPAPARYNVVVLPPEGGRQLAGLMIVPLANAPRTFPAPLTVRVSYQACGVAADAPALHLDTRTNASDPWQAIGGGDWRPQQYVEGFTNHLSAFAIAN